MKNLKNSKFKHLSATQKQVEQTLLILEKMTIELSLSPRTDSECESLVHRYYLNYPDSSIKTNTLIGCIVYIVSSKNNEHISLQTIAEKAGVSVSWLSKKKKKVASDLGLMTSIG
ncbi:MAG: cyclin family protein [Candidatus Hodarchaeota archaeon]